MVSLSCRVEGGLNEVSNMLIRLRELSVNQHLIQLATPKENFWMWNINSSNLKFNEYLRIRRSTTEIFLTELVVWLTSKLVSHNDPFKDRISF